MYKMEIQWCKEGEWKPTVFAPRDYTSALKLLAEYKSMWQHIHDYRIIKTLVK